MSTASDDSLFVVEGQNKLFMTVVILYLYSALGNVA